MYAKSNPRKNAKKQNDTITKRKRNVLNFKQKEDLINKIECKGFSKEKVATDYNIDYSSVCKIIKTKDKLVDFRLNNPESRIRKSFKGATFPELDAALLRWFYQQRSSNRPISCSILASKAKEFYTQIYANDINVKPFKGSIGFIQKFCHRYNISSKSIHGESQSNEKETAEKYVNEIFPSLIEGYSTEQIYNADETGLNYVGLPNTTLTTFQEKSASGFKMLKNRVTLMMCSNASGNHKLPLLFVHKFENPTCFKTTDCFGRKTSIDKSTLPVYYKSSTNAWMTMNIFENWFHSEFVPKVKAYLRSIQQEEKALLFIDNCPAHPMELQTDDNKFRCLFLPANTTALIQPMDQGPIANFKRKYRAQIIYDILNTNLSIPDYQKIVRTNIKLVIDKCSQLWKSISIESLKSSWHKLGLNKEHSVTLPNINLDEIRTFCDRFGLDLSDLDVVNWLENDFDDPGFQILTDQEIVQEASRLNIAEEEQEEDDEIVEIVDPVISSAKVIDYCKSVITWLDFKCSSNLHLINLKEKLQTIISLADDQIFSCKYQTSLDTFFS
jgi:hypothetical protein